MPKERGTKASKQRQVEPEEGAPRSTLKPKSVRLDAALIEQLEGMAAVREMSFSSVVRAASEMYLLREQFAVGLENVEANIGATLNATRRDINRVADDVQLLIAYVDQLAKFLMMVLPEVVDKEGAVALGNRRHAGFIADFSQGFSSRKKKSNLSAELDSLEGDNNG